MIATTLGYKTQAIDTTVEAELLQFSLWRKMTAREKIALVKRVAKRGIQLAWMSVIQAYPNFSSWEKKQIYLQKRWRNLSQECLIQLMNQDKLMLEDPIWLASYLGQILESLNIPYFIGSSVASSLQGEVRFTEDLDLVIQIEATQVSSLIERLSNEFYLSDVAVDEAIRGLTTSFNIIHLQTTEKADIFISGSDKFSASKMSRRQLYDLEEGRFYVCSPEDTILQKLLWYQLFASQSQKQWRDILGVLKLQAEKLDFAYLTSWSETLKFKEALQVALIESGLSGIN